MPIKRKKNIVKASAGQGLYKVEAEAIIMGDDIIIIVWGGTRPHVGSIAVAQPRSSLRNARRRSATSSVFNFLAHKDESVTRLFSEKIAATLNRTVVVAAGIHLEQAEKEDLRKLMKNCKQLLAHILTKLGKIL